MLDKNSRIVLKMLNRLSNDYGEIENSKLISDNMPRNYNPTKLISTLKYLQDLEYLEFYDNMNQEVTLLKLHHKGLNYKNLAWIEIKSFIIKSILIPIVVALITTLLVELLF